MKAELSFILKKHILRSLLIFQHLRCAVVIRYHLTCDKRNLISLY